MDLSRHLPPKTERKHFEEKIQRPEELYRTLFDLVPVAVYVCDADGIIQEYNRRAAELWGREPGGNGQGPRFCGSYKIYYPDGRLMPHEECPMARAVTRRKTESGRFGNCRRTSGWRAETRDSGSANSYKHSRQNHRRNQFPF